MRVYEIFCAAGILLSVSFETAVSSVLLHAYKMKKNRKYMAEVK
jgi:hypothetical protein